MHLLAKYSRPAGAAALVAALASLLACGGSSSSGTAQTPASTPATSLQYTAPAGTGYQLVQDASSTATHLVLDLVGPAGAQIRGVLLNVAADTAKTAWSHAGGTDPFIKEGQALDLGTGPRLEKSQQTGANLQAALFQKGAGAAATLGTGPILSVALDLKAGAAAGAVSLSSSASQILDAAGNTQTITVAVGSLIAK